MDRQDGKVWTQESEEIVRKAETIRQSQRLKEIPSYQNSSPKTRKTSLVLEVCRKSHQAGRQRARTAAKQQAEEVLQLHQIPEKKTVLEWHPYET